MLYLFYSFTIGKDRAKCLEEQVVADVQGMLENTGGLSLFMNERGGIRDDCIINNAGDYLYVVSNAGCAQKIRPLMQVKPYGFLMFSGGRER